MSATTASEATNVDSDAPAPRPRIRSGAIAWGVIVCAISVLVLTVVSHPGRRAEFVEWAWNLGPAGQALALVLGLGGLIVLLALLSLRRAQR